MEGAGDCCVKQNRTQEDKHYMHASFCTESSLSFSLYLCVCVCVCVCVRVCNTYDMKIELFENKKRNRAA